MLGKLSQIKNFITNAITSVQSQRPVPPNDPALESKLKFLLDFILRSPVEGQFKAYHSLQNPEMDLNQILSQIYHSQTAETDQVACIIHFYTFLLLNCNNELVLCKIVSDSFVLQLTEVYLDVVLKKKSSLLVDVQETNSYKIALIKAYVSRINDETIKYMIINDRMRIFENCIHLYEQYMKVEQEEQFGVEATCISNCILIIVRFLAERQNYSTNVCYTSGEKGIGYLLIMIVRRIHQSIQDLSQNTQLDQHRFEFLKDRILFLIDLVQSISAQDYKLKVIKQTSKELADLRIFFKHIVMNHLVQTNQNELNYVKNVELVKMLLKLLKIYFNTSELLSVYEETLLPMMNKFSSMYQRMVRELNTLIKQSTEQNQQNTAKISTLSNKKSTIINVICSNMEILASIISSGQYLSRRNNVSAKEIELKAVIINILIDLIQTILSEEAESLKNMLCHKSLKLCLLSLMQLTVQEHDLHQYSVLKLHQFVIVMFKKHLKYADNWDYIVLHYENMLKSVSSNLISIQETNPLEYGFCQFHDNSKNKSPNSLQHLINWIYMNQCVRNFRFMIVQKTEINTKDIKLQKNYHNNFISLGWNLQPGKQLNSDSFKEIFQLIHLSKGLKIPISVIEDDQCLLFAHNDGQTNKIILNIRYKSIQGFTVEKETVHIRLKGLQEVLVQPLKHTKQQLVKFKQYLIEKRDKSRERELRFIYHYLELYSRDNAKIIQSMGQADIEDSEEKENKAKQEKQKEPQHQQIDEKQEVNKAQTQTQVQRASVTQTIIVSQNNIVAQSLVTNVQKIDNL